MSETAQSESRSEDSAAGKTDGEIKAIAAETEIAAIEEGGKQGTGEVGNPADRRLPLIVRIYGIVMLIEGVVTLPIIVLSCLYVVQAVLSRRYDVRRVEPHHDSVGDSRGRADGHHRVPDGGSACCFSGTNAGTSRNGRTC